MFTPEASNDAADCGAKWSAMIRFNFLGSRNDSKYQELIENNPLFEILPQRSTRNVTQISDWYVFDFTLADYGIIVPYLSNTSIFGGLPSVLVSSECIKW